MAKITALGFVMPVRDIDKAVRFYCDAFDLTEVFRTDQIAFVGIEGTDSAVGLLLDPVAAARCMSGSILTMHSTSAT
jgi:catechol 2,3-dioxygenase-like lactoylglutathione lyase family enzyme